MIGSLAQAGEEFHEPLAILLSRKAGRPVQLVMSRDEVFRASGPAAASTLTIKFGATREEVSEAIAIAIGVNAAAIVDLTDIAAENTGMRLFDGAGGTRR